MRAYRNPRGNRREGAKRELSHSALYNVGENGRECRKEYTTELLRGRTQQQADLIEAQRNVGTSGESDERAAACCMLHVACRVLRVLCACVWTTFERSKLFADPPPRLTRLRTNNVQHGTWQTTHNMAHGIHRTTSNIFPCRTGRIVRHSTLHCTTLQRRSARTALIRCAHVNDFVDKATLCCNHRIGELLYVPAKPTRLSKQLPCARLPACPPARPPTRPPAHTLHKAKGNAHTPTQGDCRNGAAPLGPSIAPALAPSTEGSAVPTRLPPWQGPCRGR